ncbi:hypothetical protein [Nonomuraea sp. NPDC049784]|uniref:hypothetical protein n=1 Tax=Nonomuraea sp. NPDC049784 TaxID=3154361 RepID=UPI0033CB556A
MVGPNEYADWSANLLPWEACESLLEGFCEQVGLPSTAAGFVAHLRGNHLVAAAELDAGYEDNSDLVISDDGVPTVKRRRGQQTLKAAEKLAAAIERRVPERSLLSIVARTAHWLGWHHHFGPASGSDPKISDPVVPLLAGGVHRRDQPGAVRGGQAPDRGIGPGAVDDP